MGLRGLSLIAYNSEHVTEYPNAPKGKGRLQWCMRKTKNTLQISCTDVHKPLETISLTPKIWLNNAVRYYINSSGQYSTEQQ